MKVWSRDLCCMVVFMYIS